MLSFWLVPLARARPRLVLGTAVLMATALTLARYPLILRSGGGAIAGIIRIFANGNLLKYAVWFIGGIPAASHLGAFRSELARRRLGFVAGAVVLGGLGLVESERIRQPSGRNWLSPEATLLNTAFVGLLLLSFLALEGPKPPMAGVGVPRGHVRDKVDPAEKALPLCPRVRDFAASPAAWCCRLSVPRPRKGQCDRA